MNLKCMTYFENNIYTNRLEKSVEYTDWYSLKVRSSCYLHRYFEYLLFQVFSWNIFVLASICIVYLRIKIINLFKDQFKLLWVFLLIEELYIFLISMHTINGIALLYPRAYKLKVHTEEMSLQIQDLNV